MVKIQFDDIFEKIKNARIGIIGDFCLDVYWEVDRSKSEISVETKLATTPVKTQNFNLGGAGNVAANLRAMGVGEIHVFGVVANDPFGYQMKTLMKSLSIKCEGLVEQNGGWNTHSYIKPISNGVEECRIDFGNFNRLSAASVDALIKNISDKMVKLDVVIINQQVAMGIHNSTMFRKELQRLITENPGKIFLLDSRDAGDSYRETIRKMNSFEALTLCGTKCEPQAVIAEDDAKLAGLKLHRKYGKTIFVTRGDRGCLVIDRGKVASIPGLHIVDNIDTVGAGDSMLAGIAAAIAGGKDPVTAAKFGNLVAGVTVQKLCQTGTASPDEIRKMGSDTDYVFLPEKADSLRTAKYFRKTEIEIVGEAVHVDRISNAIFDHDGTISVLREGWEKIMEPMMMKAILGPEYLKAAESDYNRVLDRSKKFIDGTTGIQTLIQMQGLVKLVREFGFVPEKDILDEFGYKEIYNKDLLELVKGRIDKLKKGELCLEDYVMKGVVPFLKRLFDAGVTLYLASGSDEGDVIAEAKELGYADLFGGRIYGSVGDVTKEAKKIVMDRIVADIGAKNAKQIVTFGDGPVEIREINKRGGLAIGVASDEVRRFGLNLKKRSRLIRAGADIIIPDFSQSDALCGILKIK